MKEILKMDKNGALVLKEKAQTSTEGNFQKDVGQGQGESRKLMVIFLMATIRKDFWLDSLL